MVEEGMRIGLILQPSLAGPVDGLSGHVHGHPSELVGEGGGNGRPDGVEDAPDGRGLLLVQLRQRLEGQQMFDAPDSVRGGIEGVHVASVAADDLDGVARFFPEGLLGSSTLPGVPDVAHLLVGHLPSTWDGAELDLDRERHGRAVVRKDDFGGSQIAGQNGRRGGQNDQSGGRRPAASQARGGGGSRGDRARRCPIRTSGLLCAYMKRCCAVPLPSIVVVVVVATIVVGIRSGRPAHD